jgi:histidinol phosphatase-like PHP family hydrolase
VATANWPEIAYSRTGPLCELHAHTTMSDGELTLGELVDLYGRYRFDVLCVTDHCVRSSDPWLGTEPEHVHAGSYDAYVGAIRLEARLYGHGRCTTCCSCRVSS